MKFYIPLLIIMILSILVIAGDTTSNLKEYTISNPVIKVNQSEQVKIDGNVYNITYIPIIKCICEKKTGCQIKECLQ